MAKYLLQFKERRIEPQGRKPMKTPNEG